MSLMREIVKKQSKTEKLGFEKKNTENKDTVNAKPKVAFICVHNSCRSQIAEALGKHFAGDVYVSYSAGTELRPSINQDAAMAILPPLFKTL
jgi:hypothetical protein